MSEHEAIPAKAWEGVGDPTPNLHGRCFSCGGSNVRDLSMAKMMQLPSEQVVNANTYMIPNMAWGYIQCDDCEARQLAEKASVNDRGLRYWLDHRFAPWNWPTRFPVLNGVLQAAVVWVVVTMLFF